jgi:hypothetical protein
VSDRVEERSEPDIYIHTGFVILPSNTKLIITAPYMCSYTHNDTQHVLSVISQYLHVPKGTGTN